jgi:hypothetical protein
VSPSVSAPTADDVPAVTPSSSDAADAPTSSSAVPSSADDTSGVASNPQSSAADNPDSPDATSGCAMHNPARSRSGALGLLVGVVSLVLVARRSRNLVARHSSGFAALDASTSRGHAEAPVTPESPSTLARGRFGGHG